MALTIVFIHIRNGGSNYNNHFGDKSIRKDVIPYEVIEVPISDLSVVPARQQFSELANREGFWAKQIFVSGFI